MSWKLATRGREELFWTAYGLKRPGLRRIYRDLDPHKQSFDSLSSQQSVALTRMIRFASRHVPHYRTVVSDSGIRLGDNMVPSDMQALPILSKSKIKADPSRFFAEGYAGAYSIGRTGGSTGEPLEYRHDGEDYKRGVALLIRMWEQGGYSVGDRMAILAGWSLTSRSQPVRQRVSDALLSFRHYSSFGMGTDDMDGYFRSMARWRPTTLRGYPSSLYLLARHFLDNGIAFDHQINCVFTTAEVLTPGHREAIEVAFRAPVFNHYGLNDGGVTAWECPIHNGLHVDVERSLLEVVDESGRQIMDTPGRVLATSLHNFAMPFIRYDTGDVATMSSTPCPCGNPKPLLTQLHGRTTDSLHINGRFIGSPVLTVLMGTMDVRSYQIAQTGPSEIVVRLDVDESKQRAIQDSIRKSVIAHVGGVSIRFETLEVGQYARGNKHRFIINEFESDDR